MALEHSSIETIKWKLLEFVIQINHKCIKPSSCFQENGSSPQIKEKKKKSFDSSHVIFFVHKSAWP
jgi:hypothetical protein